MPTATVYQGAVPIRVGRRGEVTARVAPDDGAVRHRDARGLHAATSNRLAVTVADAVTRPGTLGLKDQKQLYLRRSPAPPTSRVPMR